MMKCFVAIVCLVAAISVGCGSDSNENSRILQTSPVGPTKTFDVPGTYSSIQKAINAAGNGDFIRVAAGVYAENLVIKSKSFSLRGAGIGQTTINGSVKIDNASEVSFEGFTVKGGGMYVRNSSVRITGNEILESAAAGLWLESCRFSLVVSDNTISKSGKEGLLLDDSAGVIGSNTIKENTMDGVVVNNSSPTLQGNTVSSNGRDGISIRGFISYSTPLLLGNTIQKNGGISNYDIICFGETNPTGSGNVFDKCINCGECRSLGSPFTYQD